MTAHEKELEDQLGRLRESLSKLSVENEQLREECGELRSRYMTRYEQFKSAKDPDELATMLHKVYMTGVADGNTKLVTEGYFHTVQDVTKWLQEVGKI